MDDIEILNRIRELRRQCCEMHVELRLRSSFTAADRMGDAWRAIASASVEFEVETLMCRSTSEASASGTGIPVEPSEKSGENHG